MTRTDPKLLSEVGEGQGRLRAGGRIRGAESASGVNRRRNLLAYIQRTVGLDQVRVCDTAQRTGVAASCLKLRVFKGGDARGHEERSRASRA